MLFLPQDEKAALERKVKKLGFQLEDIGKLKARQDAKADLEAREERLRMVRLAGRLCSASLSDILLQALPSLHEPTTHQ